MTQNADVHADIDSIDISLSMVAGAAKVLTSAAIILTELQARQGRALAPQQRAALNADSECIHEQWQKIQQSEPDAS